MKKEPQISTEDNEEQVSHFINRKAADQNASINYTEFEKSLGQ